MARKNVEKVFKAWLAGHAARGPKGTIWTDGQVIYSYRMPICVRDTLADLSATISKDSPTITTTIHRNQVRYLCHMEGIRTHDTDSHMVKTMADMATGRFFAKAA